MRAIQEDLVHYIKPGYCKNCKHAKEVHLDGACLFDSSNYQEETLADHSDCACESVVELGTAVKDNKDSLSVSINVFPKVKMAYLSATYVV